MCFVVLLRDYIKTATITKTLRRLDNFKNTCMYLNVREKIINKVESMCHSTRSLGSVYTLTR